MKNTQKHVFRSAALAFALAAAGELPAAETAPAAAVAGTPQAVFASVGGAVITQGEYATAFGAAARAKFFHGKPPQNEIAQLQRDVGEQMVARIVLLNEAKQRGLRPDGAEVDKTVQSYEQRYANSEHWKKSRAQMLPALVERLEQESLLNQLEKDVRGRVAPADKDAQAYYLKHPEKFTEPEQLRVSVILLKVDPSSPTAVWTKAEEEAQGIVKRLRDGADLAELARLHSGDRSAQQGGDMGYLHAGMLPAGAHEVLDKMQPGQISDAVRLLEGVAVFRLTDRKLARPVAFETVRERARDLMVSEQKDAAWSAFVAELKKKTPTQMDQSLFLPMAQPSNDQGNLK